MLAIDVPRIAFRAPVALLRKTVLPAKDYDLHATLSSGQAFRWTCRHDAWESVVNGRWVRFTQGIDAIIAEAVEYDSDWTWLTTYLQSDTDLRAILATFPDDLPMRSAVETCRGLRLLRQDPWECLASFICSSTKQIVQIQQIVRLLCERFGERVAVPPGTESMFAFPSVERIAASTEAELRACKMGFRAPYLLATARMLSADEIRPLAIAAMPVEQARSELMKLPGVGRKIADCVLLFAYGFQQAFPVDVWVMRALRQLYFPRRRRVSLRHLHEFSANHFGPNAGYAQQYLFHYMRVKKPIRTTP